jgi:hypothetical protein
MKYLSINKNSQLLFALLILLALVASSCAGVTDIEACRTEPPYGFFAGLLHGFIAPFSFVVSLFMDNVAIYEINNNGGWYDFGFCLGAGILFGGGSRASRKRS